MYSEDIHYVLKVSLMHTFFNSSLEGTEHMVNLLYQKAVFTRSPCVYIYVFELYLNKMVKWLSSAETVYIGQTELTIFFSLIIVAAKTDSCLKSILQASLFNMHLNTALCFKDEIL